MKERNLSDFWYKINNSVNIINLLFDKRMEGVSGIF